VNYKISFEELNSESIDHIGVEGFPLEESSLLKEVIGNNKLSVRPSSICNQALACCHRIKIEKILFQQLSV